MPGEEPKWRRDLSTPSGDGLPGKIIGRDAQIKALETYLLTAASGRKPVHVWLHGRPGTGKTTVAKHVTSQLANNPRVEVAYVNCWQHPTLFLVLQRIVESLRLLIPDNANSVVKLNRILSHLGGKPLLLILDELDKAPPKERNSILYALTEMGNVGIIAISNSRECLFELEGRVTSRFSPMQIGFDPYSPEHLRLILEEQAKSTLTPSSWSPDTLRRCVELAEGDARVAVNALRTGAEHAAIDSAPVITPSHIERGWTTAHKLKIQYRLKRLTEHHRLLVEIVDGQGEISSGLLWATYLQRCKDIGLRPVADRTFSLYINTLASQGFLNRDRVATPGSIFVLRPAS